jgi:OOP family OmpA-OmpF porin
MKNRHILALFITMSVIIPARATIFYHSYTDLEKYKLTIKGNYKIYHNNSYKGLKVNEVKGLLSVDEIDPRTSRVSGNVYHYTKTIRGNNLVGYTVDAFQSCSFILHHTGQVSESDNPVFPPVQGLPSFPEREIRAGEVYQIYGRAGVNLYNSSTVVEIETLSTLRYEGTKSFMGRDLDYFTIQYGYGDVLTPGTVTRAVGKHTLELYFDNYTGKPVFMRDKFVEEFQLPDGDIIKHDGFYLYFYKLIYPMDKKKTIDNMEEIIQDKLDEEYFTDLDFKQRDDGIAITLNDLKFKPDSTILLGTELAKLDAIAEALKNIPDRSFMIIGHTAEYGTVEARKKLSLERGACYRGVSNQPGHCS